MSKFALIGCGYWGMNILRTSKNLGQLDFVIDDDEKKLEQISQDYQVAKITFESALNSDEIKNFYISTPAETHFEIAKKLLLNYKNVFVEKPITLDIQEAEELIHIAEENKSILMVGHLLQYHPAIIKIKELINDKLLGKLKRVICKRASLGKVRSHEDVLWSFSPHDISLINYFCAGKVYNIQRNRVKVFSDNYDRYAVDFMYGDTYVSLEADWGQIIKKQSLELYFEKGIFYFDDADPEKKIIFHNVDFNKSTLMEKVQTTKKHLDFDNSSSPLENELAHFKECVKSNSQPITDGFEGLACLKLLRVLSE